MQLLGQKPLLSTYCMPGTGADMNFAGERHSRQITRM